MRKERRKRKGGKMKILKLKNIYTGAFVVKEVKDNFPVRDGQVISFNEDITDSDYKLYRVMGIKEKNENNQKK